MKNRCEAPIGVFDSGVGGLTVVREIMRNLPNEEIVYFGDTARVPYGSKSKETVTRYSRQIVRFLQSKEVKAIVVACNTASAYALETIKKELDIPIIGVVEPGARVACETTVNDRIGVIGTEATVHSGIYTSFIRRQKPDVQVVSKACPLFVPLVEEGWLKDPITMEVRRSRGSSSRWQGGRGRARRYLEELLQYDIDTLILGCTHYPLLRSTVQKIVGDKVNLVNPAYETARDLKKLLERENLSNPDTETDPSEMSHRFYVSDAADKFNKFANSILPYDIDTTQEIPIEEY